jgi:hypothetical protein
MVIQLRYDEHLLSKRKELLDDKDFSDTVLITKKGIFHGHFSLFLQQIPSLAKLVCEGCIANHEKIVIFLPEVGPSELSIALVEFYMKGDVDKLETILGVVNVNKQPVQREISKDTEKYVTGSELHNTKQYNSKEICHSLSEDEILNVNNANADTTNEVLLIDTSKVKNENNALESNQNRSSDENGLHVLMDSISYGSNITTNRSKFVEEDNRREMLIMCDLCEKDYETVYGLDMHMTKVHGLGKYEERSKHECPYCGKSVAYIDKHIRTAHKEASGMLICDVCRKTVDNDLKKHRGECIFCPFCDYKNLKKARLLKHIETLHTTRRNMIQTKPMDLTSKIGLCGILNNKKYWKM